MLNTQWTRSFPVLVELGSFTRGLGYEIPLISPPLITGRVVIHNMPTPASHLIEFSGLFVGIPQS